MNDKREGQLNIITDLKRELTLTKEDLRFMDFILKTVETNSNSSSKIFFSYIIRN